LLIAGYALLGIAATSRSAVQISTRWDDAPLAYTLSAAAAVVYLVATACFVIGSTRARRLAHGLLVFELAGVLIVGVLSFIDSQAFPDQTVWSYFGAGYLLIPLALPVLGLLWLRRTASPSSSADPTDEDAQPI
jgi:hypothetical protein